MVSQDVRITAEDNNFTVNKRSAAEAETILGAIRSNALLFLDTLSASGQGAAVNRRISAYFFERNPDLAAVVLAGRPDFAPAARYVNSRFFLANELDEGLIDSFLGAHRRELERAEAGEFNVLSGAAAFGTPLLVMLIPRDEGGTGQAVAVFFSAESLTETFGTGANSTYMINAGGDLLVHPDYDLVRQGANLGGSAFIRSVRENPEESLQILYTEEGGERFFGAFTKLPLGALTVITAIEYDVVFEGIRATTRRNIYLTAAVLFIAVLFVWFFSKTISSPLKALAHAAGLIEEGQYDLDLKSRTRDEIGLLTGSFVKMGKGLAERERLKDAFGRFTNREIAERAMRGELTLGGETKLATIFFSDIRSFTAISEKLEPHEVVEFLNQYMTRMVECVEKTGGVVDKFIGDAVMAVWGAPVSAGSPAGDALSCVKAALMMRSALREFNQGRGGEKKPLIKIGCGINTGDVVAGQIGSSRRMEYTVIGDAVNLASRTEALNKPFGTDILITENTWDLIGGELITEEMPPVSVKGKEKPVRMFAVVNLASEGSIPGTGPGGPRSLRAVRELLGIPAPDLAKVDTGAEEQKYKIGE
jgi:adenylate cyclase